MAHSAQLKLRIRLDQQIALGPGKADLLDAIIKTGSISSAAKCMSMSYRRAWQLVEIMNQSFLEPVVLAHRGGETGGGAVVTDFGQALLAQYRKIEQIAQAAIEQETEVILKQLKAPLIND